MALDQTTPEPYDPLAEERMREGIKALVAKLKGEADRRVQRRAEVERRWLKDLQQYHGVYDAETSEEIRRQGGSQAFINLTATKTEAMEARLFDLLFPTDDANWGIEPTPVPELSDQLENMLDEVVRADEEAAAQAEIMQQQAMAAQANPQAPDAPQKAQQAMQAEAAMRDAEKARDEAQAAADDLQMRVDEASRRCDLMRLEIEDNLVSCQYPSEVRDMLGDACRMGTGIMKGPVIGEGMAQRWVHITDKEGKPAGYELKSASGNMPACYRVDPWSFFPDPDARRIQDGEGTFERHLLNKQEMRRLARQEGADRAALAEIIKEEPSKKLPAFVADLQSITGSTDGNALSNRYEVWEYRGPLDAEHIELLASTSPNPEGMAAAIGEIDVLEEMHVVVKFCQGHVISFAIHPLDSGESIYSVFNIRKDEASIFGFGIPHIMAHGQSILNGAYRMMMDNAALSTGPQIVIDKEKIQPEDGEWRMTARKVWNWVKGSTAKDNKPPFYDFSIDGHQGELQAIIVLASQTIDEITAMPQIAQGEQGAGVTKTAQGMALLMNSANVTFRRIVKNFDDDVTVPLIRRFYHWNMQFSDKDAIKGDYDVHARGSSVLLVREMQAQNLVAVAQMFGDHPVYGPMLKHSPLLRQIFRAHMISADEIVKTDREYKKFVEESAGQTDPMVELKGAELELKKEDLDLRREESQAKVEIANMEADWRLKIAKMDYDKSLEAVAARMNMSREQLEMKMSEVNAKLDSSERKMAAEIGMVEKTGMHAGGSI